MENKKIKNILIISSIIIILILFFSPILTMIFRDKVAQKITGYNTCYSNDYFPNPFSRVVIFDCFLTDEFGVAYKQDYFKIDWIKGEILKKR